MVSESDFEIAGEFNGQFTDVFTKAEHSNVPLLCRKDPFKQWYLEKVYQNFSKV